MLMKRTFLFLLVGILCGISVSAAEPDYLTLTNTGTSSATVYFRRQSGNNSNTLNIEWSVNGGAWSDPREYKYTNSYSITVPAGQNVRFRGNNTVTEGGVTKCRFSTSLSVYWNITSTTGKFTATGDVMSLAAYDEVADVIHDEYPLADYCFNSLFCSGSNNKFTTLEDASDLRLPATQLGAYCYRYMFNQCTALRNAPALPATSLANNCYNGMFHTCRALTQAPALPATELANYCYAYMFNTCVALTTAPALPATTLTEGCYQHMFDGCTALTSVPDTLPGTNMPKFCYEYMFNECTSLTAAPEIMATADAVPGQGACNNMFGACSSLVKAPSVLRPLTLNVNMVYYNMFLNCTSLERGPDMQATAISSSNPLYGMYQRASKVNHIRVHFTKWGTMSFCNSWTYGVSTMGAFYCPPELPREYSSTSYWNKVPLSTDNPWTIFSYNLTYVPVGGEWPRGGTDPRQYTWETDTSEVQGWMRLLDSRGAEYFHDAECTQPFAEEDIIAFLATQQESSSDITKNIYVRLGAAQNPDGERYQYIAYALADEDSQPDFECTPASRPVVLTNDATSVPVDGAVLNGKVTSDGGKTVTERGFCWGTDAATPECIAVGNGMGSFSYTLSGLTPSTTYYVQAYATNSVGTATGEILTFTTPDPPAPEEPTGTTCNHEWVQLWEGGPKWATVNLGASAPEDAGDYYMYADTRANPSSCTWANYPYKGSNQNTAPYTKYGVAGDGKLVLDEGDDAAAQAWGCEWRIPTKEEFDDLLTNCTVTYNMSKRGYTFTSKENTSLSIFMPTAGYKNGGSIFNVGRYARYLTATSVASPTTKDRDCLILYWYTNSSYQEDHKPETRTQSVRYWGMSVRAVCR